MTFTHNSNEAPHLLHVAVAGVDRADGALVYEVSVRPSLPQASHTARTR